MSSLKLHESPPNRDVKLSNALCYWENRTTGCNLIKCPLFHKKARTINGLFLPPSLVTHGGKENGETEDLRIPIHPPLIIHITEEEEDDEEEEQDDYTAEHRARNPEEEEEERAIMAVCRSAGDLYKVHIHGEFRAFKSCSPNESEITYRSLEAEFQEGGDSPVQDVSNKDNRTSFFYRKDQETQSDSQTDKGSQKLEDWDNDIRTDPGAPPPEANGWNPFNSRFPLYIPQNQGANYTDRYNCYSRGSQKLEDWYNDTRTEPSAPTSKGKGWNPFNSRFPVYTPQNQRFTHRKGYNCYSRGYNQTAHTVQPWK